MTYETIVAIIAVIAVTTLSIAWLAEWIICRVYKAKLKYVATLSAAVAKAADELSVKWTGKKAEGADDE